jgi:hypothetical protein
MPQGGWQFLTAGETDNDPNILYFSTHHIIVDGSKVTAWFRWEYQNDVTEGVTTYRSVASREQLDCTRAAEIVISEIVYSGQNMEGTASSQVFDLKTVRWTPIIPGTIGEAELDWACNKVLKEAHQRRGR